MPPLFRRRSNTLYVFLHVPKCAGTSVVHSLSRVGSKRALVVSESPDSKAQALEFAQRSIRDGVVDGGRLEVIMGHDAYFGIHRAVEVAGPRAQGKIPFYFTFVRDPYRRYVSHYRYLVDCAQHPGADLHEFAKSVVGASEPYMSLDEFAERKLMPDVQTQYLANAADPELARGRWEQPNSEILFARANEAIERCGFVGTVETIDEDLTAICKILRVRKASTGRNASRTQVASKPDAATQRRIEENNELDRRLVELARRRHDELIARFR